MGEQEKNLELIDTRQERLSNKYYTFQDVKEEIESCKATCKKGRKPLKTSIIWAIITITINWILISRGVVSGRSGLLLLPFIPVELHYLYILYGGYVSDDFRGLAFLINIPVISASINIGNVFFPIVNMFIVVLGLTIYKTLILGISCSLDLKTTISDLKHYKSILKDLNNKRGDLTCEEYDKQIFDKIAEYNNMVTGINLYTRALICNTSESLDLIKESAEYGNVNAQKVLEKYDEFLKLANAEVVDYHNLLNFSNDEPLKSITEEYLKHCEVKDSCNKDSLVKLKELGNENADRIIKNLVNVFKNTIKIFAIKEYEKYKEDGREDLQVLKQLADFGSYDACAEYAMQRYKEVTVGNYTENEKREEYKKLVPTFEDGKKSENEVYKTCCKILSLQIKYQPLLHSNNKNFEDTLATLRKIDLGDSSKDVTDDQRILIAFVEIKLHLDYLRKMELDNRYNDVFNIDVKSILETLIQGIIKIINEFENPVKESPVIDISRAREIAELKEIKEELKRLKAETTIVGTMPGIDVSDI